jgi:hypothetical protein
VQELYKVMPDLEAQIQKNKMDFEVLQQKRAEVLLQKKSTEGQLKLFSNVAEYPDVELNSEALTSELVSINKHNGSKAVLQRKATQATNDVQMANNKISFIIQNIETMKNQVIDLEKQIESLHVKINEKQQEQLIEQTILATTIGIENECKYALNSFVEKSDIEVKSKLMSSQGHNEKAKKKQQYLTLVQTLNHTEDVSVNCLNEMKKLQSEKLEICRKSKMPIPGLAIGEECLIYQFPGSNGYYNLNSLSTGQKWVVALALHAKLNPNCKILFIESMNDLDKDNEELIYKYAQESGIQLILHNTLKESSDKEFKITIKDTISEVWG